MRKFSDYMHEVISNLKSEERFGTAYIYGYALHAFQSFIGGGEIYFGALNRGALKRFENHLRNKQRSWNTVSTYMRALRTVYNNAVDQGIIQGEYRLFNSVFTGAKSDRKLALPAEQVHHLLKGELSEELNDQEIFTAKMQQARDMLALMLLLQGMPFTDIIHLKREDLSLNRAGQEIISCRRQKTGTELNVVLVPEAKDIINRYLSKDIDSPYLLYFFDGKTNGEEIYQKYRKCLRELNYHLSKLPKFRGLNIKVSSYTARHTWATLAKFCEVPEEVISEGLGHSSLEVTRTYLKRFEDDKLDKANRIIISYVFQGKQQSWNHHASL